MTRAILISIVTMLLPVAAGAEDKNAPQPVNTEALVLSLAATPSQQQTAPAPPAEPKSRRRPSMVGYIDDGLVGSRVRVRFDAGFHNNMPDQAEFFYAKCGCYKGLANIIPQAFDSNAPGPGPGVPTDINFQQLYLDIEYAPRDRVSFFTEIPSRWIEPQSFKPLPPFAPFSNQAGLGDVRAGVKLAIVSSADRSLTAQVRGYFPSGSASKGLGTNHASVEPALLYFQRLSDRLVLESQIGDWHPIGGSAGVPTANSEKFSGDVFFYGVGPSYELYSGERIQFAPVVELVGWSVRSGFQTEPGGSVLGAATDVGGTNIVNLKFGGRVTLHDRSSFYVGYGRALTNAVWYNDIVRLEYRYSF